MKLYICRMSDFDVLLQLCDFGSRIRSFFSVCYILNFTNAVWDIGLKINLAEIASLYTICNSPFAPYICVASLLKKTMLPEYLIQLLKRRARSM